ncbi:helix-turn-helix domain-containing protein [Dyella telluris]
MTLARVKGYIEQHLAERLQLADLAAITKLSVSRFISAFRCSTGTPPYRYLVQRRVAAAAVLIRETNRTLTQIAQETGFSDQSHLCRSFAQVLRMTPGNYRRIFR